MFYYVWKKNYQILVLNCVSIKLFFFNLHPVYKLPIIWGRGEVIVRKPTPLPKKRCQRNRKKGIKNEQKKTQKGIRAFVWVHSIFVILIRRDYVNYATYLLLIWSLLQVSPLFYVIAKDKFSILQKWLQDGEQYAKENGLVFLETSAKTAQNVNELFYEIGNSSYLFLLIFFWIKRNDLSLHFTAKLHLEYEGWSSLQSFDMTIIDQKGGKSNKK